MTERKKGTETSSFGTKGRFSHDSSKFYNSRLYEGIKNGGETPYIENEVPPNLLNKIFCKSSEHMEELPDNSVHLMVTSPPYNVGKDYDENLSLQEYLNLLARVFTETHRVLVPGGRACVNVANLGRKPYIPLHKYIIEIMDKIGFLMRGEIIWNKAGNASPSTAWGSFGSASNPTLRDVHEYILVFSKDTFKRENPTKKDPTISKEDFMELTKSVWAFSPESARKVGHPAPFPVELPYRTIQLYTFKGDVVLDPFVGSGTTCIAALKTGRSYVAYDNDQNYVNAAEQRINRFLQDRALENSKLNL